MTRVQTYHYYLYHIDNTSKQLDQNYDKSTNLSLLFISHR